MTDDFYTFRDMFDDEIARKKQAAELGNRPMPWTPTLEEILILEPALKVIEAMVDRLSEYITCEDDVTAMWYGYEMNVGIKNVMACLFGFGRTSGPKVLQGHVAYEIVTDHLLGKLHDSIQVVDNC